MQISETIGKLKLRAKASGFSMKDVCLEAGVHFGTPSRISKRGKAHMRTLVDLSLALNRLERRRLALLQAWAESKVPEND